MAQGTLPGFISALRAGLRPVALRNGLRASRAHPSFPSHKISGFIDRLRGCPANRPGILCLCILLPFAGKLTAEIIGGVSMDYLNAFLCGGILCAIGQILIDKTQLTPARILTGYVVAGVILSALGVYQPIADWGGAGATVPLTGFGHALAKGVSKAVAEKGWLGVLTGGLTATAGGISAAVVFGVLMALIFKPGEKR